MLKIVIDSNVYISAIATRSFSYDLLLQILTHRNLYQIFISQDLWTELHATTTRLIKKKILDQATTIDILELVKKLVHNVVPKERVSVVRRDTQDNKTLECAFAAKANIIISMDKDLLVLKTFRGIAILHPKTFFYMLPGE